MTECILIKDFNHSCSGCEAGCQNVSIMTAARPEWMTSNKVSGSSLLMSVSGRITIFPPFICMQDQPYFAARHNVMKNMHKAQTLFKKITAVMIVLNQLLPLALSQLTTGCLLEKVNKTARNLSTSNKIRSSNPALARNVD